MKHKSNVLKVINLHKIISDKMLAKLFGQYPGFKEVRLIPGR